MSSDISKKSVSIYIDQTAANLALEDLNVKAKALRESIDRGTAAGKNMNAEIKRLATTTESIKSVQTQIDNGLRLSMAQTYNQVVKLRNELKKMSEDAPGYAAKFDAYKKVTSEFNRMNEALKGVTKTQKNWLQDAKSVAFGVVIGNTVQSAIASITGYFSGIISGNAKMSDSLAKVQQTTGFTTEEVKKLAASLRTIDTRTAQGDLLKIAEIGGQFNVPRDQIKGFVEQIDKANVVLSGQFSGGIEEVSTQLSLLRNVFVDIKSDRMDNDLGHISNALIDLAQKGTATAPIIAEFGKRLSPLISTAKLTSAEVLALGTTMGGVGIPAERGGTAVVRIFDAMTSHTEAFSKVAGMTEIAFKKLFQQDSFGAFKAVLEGFKKGGDNVLALNATLHDMEIHGIGAKEALVKLSNNIEDLSQYAALGTRSLTNMNSINEKFNLNNQTLGANLEKLSKNIGAWFANSTLTSFFNGMINGLVEMTTKTKSATDSFDEQVKSMVDLQMNIVPLLSRYDELKTKTTLNKDEQTEMKKIISQISSVIPGAVTAFDDYGNAIAISTDRVKDFINAEKARLKVTNADAIEENKKSLKRVEDDLKNHKKIIDQITSKGTFNVYETHNDSNGIQTEDIRKANQAEIALAEQKYRDLIEKKLGYETQIKKLNGDAIQEQIDAANKAKADALANKGKGGKGDVPVDEDEVNKQQEILEKLKNFKFELDQIGRDGEEKEIERVKRTYKELMTEAVAHGVALVGLKEAQSRAIAFLLDKERKEETARQDKEFKENAAADYENQLKVSADFFELKKQEQARQYADGLITKEQYEAAALVIDVEAKKQDIATAQEYAINVKKAETDLYSFKKNLTDKEIAEAIKKREILIENEKLLLELRNKSELTFFQNKANNSPDGSAAKYNYEKAARDAQKKQELAAIEKQEADYKKRGIAFTDEFENEKEAIRLKFKKEDEQSEVAYYTQKIDKVIAYVQQSLSIVSKVNQAISNAENAAFNREVLQNNRRKTMIEQLGKSKVLTEVEAQRQLNAIQLDEDKKKRDLEIKQFNRQKAISLAQALINGAEAITRDLAKDRWMIPFDIATTATEVGVIATSTPKLAKGGALSGPSHSFGGMPIIDPISGRAVAEVEGGEYVLSRATVANNKTLADMLLNASMNQGGQRVTLPEWQSRQYIPIDYAGINSRIAPKFASGGVFSYDNRPSTTMQGSSSAASVVTAEQHVQLMQAVLHRLENPVPPNLIFSTAKLDDAVAGKARIVANASA